MNALTKSLMTNGLHALLIGPTGTGKSLSINKLIKAEFDNELWTYYQVGFSA
jgi:transcriptional regulator with AAA-type ATPase domain